MENKPKLLERDSFYLALMALVIIGFCSRILFTDQIIRASDVITQFFWSAKGAHDQSILDFLRGFPGIFRADWDPLSDGGRTLEGGWNAIGFLVHRYLIQHFFPFPACIAWLAVLAMCWGAIGTFKFSRLVGIGRWGAFVAGITYVLCSENATLINAGHIQKLEAICWIPWVLYFMERGFRSRRIFHFAMAALMLALQFFHMHWQISFYTCLAVGAYALFHLGACYLADGKGYRALFGKDLLLTVCMVALFFSTIAMSFVPLVSWSKQSERGDAATTEAAGAAAAATPKGIGFEEGMSWSLPPEEVLTYVVPGLFGLSRQEGGDSPAPDMAYYWGRMRFTQTSDYLGLLTWFLVPLPVLWRRNRYTWFCTFLMGMTMLMALGQYTPVYRFMFEHLPAFSKFRVPKMILCLFAFGAAVLTGSGLDLLVRGDLERKRVVRWLAGCCGLVLCIAALRIVLQVGMPQVLSLMGQYIYAPTRYQSGQELVAQRYAFALRESSVAVAVGCAYLALFFAWFRKWLPTKAFLPLLVVLLLGDLWRVNTRFFVVTAPPAGGGAARVKNDIVDFLKPRIDRYRMQPMNDENAHFYADNGFPNVSAYVTISERRYKEFLDSFNLMSGMPDIMNLKYLILPSKEYEQQKGALALKYQPVFLSSNGSVVLENKTVLPKAWLVPSVAAIPDSKERVGIMSTDARFNPAVVALVETPPPLPLAPFGQQVQAGTAQVTEFQNNVVTVQAAAQTNALLVLGEKYYSGWNATVDGAPTQIHPVDHVLRGVYLTPGMHKVQFIFDPLPFKIGKWLTVASFALFACILGREALLRRRSPVAVPAVQVGASLTADEE